MPTPPLGRKAKTDSQEYYCCQFPWWAVTFGSPWLCEVVFGMVPSQRKLAASQEV